MTKQNGQFEEFYTTREVLLMGLNALGLDVAIYDKLEPYMDEMEDVRQNGHDVLDMLKRQGSITPKYYDAISFILQ